MNWIFTAVVLGGLVSLALTPLFIRFQKNRHMGQRIRTDGPQSHSIKAGTPTMGGVVFISAAVVSYAAVILIKYFRYGDFSYEGAFAASMFLFCGLIGFVDDSIALKKKRNLGLRGWVKIGLLVAVCVYFVLISRFVLKLDTSIGIPFTGLQFQLGNWYYFFPVIIIISCTNAVNLTDGLDGLAAGSSAIVLTAFCFIAFLEWSILQVSYSIDISVICGAALAACAGFLWWNTAPAEIFMGDTGSFGLGGLIAAVAIILKQEILLIVIGGLFALETLSVIIQVFWFKLKKRRVFKMAPLHHHFELLGWPEIKVIIRFWIIAALFAGLGFFIYYLKFID
jgi:phospho-N-acetylmuramoyl-pentapeptide-transferase